MIFTPHHANLVLNGEKWQTRRLVKEGDWHTSWPLSPRTAEFVYRSGRLLWAVGKDYAICPGRGEKAICRRKLVSICKEPLWEIHAGDALAEGVKGPLGDGYAAVQTFFDLWDTIHKKRGTCSQDNPSVWVLTFERKRGQ